MREKDQPYLAAGLLLGVGGGILLYTYINAKAEASPVNEQLMRYATSYRKEYT